VTEIERLQADYDLICLPVGTGGTIAGIASKIPPGKKVLGFVVLKGAGYLEGVVEDFVRQVSGFNSSPNWSLNHDYHLGGYAKCPASLKQFIVEFEADHQIQLDPVYTGKMLFGLSRMIESGELKGSDRIVVVHTGGLQGRRGFRFSD
jgi:1-aminocyclopropane-1-carboxylate deaminase